MEHPYLTCLLCKIKISWKMSDFDEIRNHLKFEHDIVKYEVDLLLHLCLINSKERNVIITTLGPRLDWFAVNGVIQTKNNLFEVGTGTRTGSVNVNLTDSSEEETEILDANMMDESMYFSFSETLTQSDCGQSEERFVENKQENIFGGQLEQKFVENKQENIFGGRSEKRYVETKEESIFGGQLEERFVENKQEYIFGGRSEKGFVENKQENIFCEKKKEGAIKDSTHQNKEKNKNSDGMIFPIELKQDTSIKDAALNSKETLNISSYRARNSSNDNLDNVDTNDIVLSKDRVVTSPIKPFKFVVQMLAEEVESLGEQEPEAPRKEEISWLNSTAIVEGLDKASDESWLVGSMDEQEPRVVNTTFEVNDKPSNYDLLQCSSFTDSVKTRSGKRLLDAEGVVENKKKAAKTEENIYELISL